MSSPTLRLDAYRRLGDSGLMVSPLCLGTMTFGTAWGWGADEETSRAIFDAYADAGGNFIDTADFYTNGESERLVGDFVRTDRDRFIVATKYTINRRRNAADPNAGGNARRSMIRGLEASLKRMKLEAVDLFWLHMWDFSTPVDEVMRAFDDLVRSGKVHYIAISDTPAWKIAQLNTYAHAHALTRFVATQQEYSLIRRDLERDVIPMARELGVAVLPWSPLGGGVLTGKYTRQDLEAQQAAAKDKRGGGDPFDSENRMIQLTERKISVAEAVRTVADEIGASPAQVALRWLLTRAGVTSVIIGARKMNQIEDNLGALAVDLGEDHLETLEKASRIELGFPHDFVRGPFVRELITGGADVEFNPPYV